MELSAMDFAYTSRGNAFTTRNSFCATQHSSFPPLSKKESSIPRPSKRGERPTTVEDIIRLHLLVFPSILSMQRMEKHGKVVIEFSIRNEYIYILERI